MIKCNQLQRESYNELNYKAEKNRRKSQDKYIKENKKAIHKKLVLRQLSK